MELQPLPPRTQATWPPAACDLVVFDLDGTLIDLPIDWRTLRREVGALAAAAGVRTSDRRVLPLLDVSRRLEMRPLHRAIEATIRRAELAAVADGAPIEHAIAAVRELPPWVTVGVLTSASRQAAELAVERCGLAGRVAAILGRDDVLRRKPNPEGLFELMARFSAGPARTVVVGDEEVDLACAARAGARGLEARTLSSRLQAA